MVGKVLSMTAFGRSEGGDDGFRWAWEIRSVNGRGFDCRVRTPSGCERLDPIIRKTVSSAVTRGSISVNLDMKRHVAGAQASIDENLLERLIEACKSRGEEPRIEQLLAVRGVVGAETEKIEDLLPEDRFAQLQQDLTLAVEDFMGARRSEGAALEALLTDNLNQIEALTIEARGLDATRLETIRDRFSAQLSALMGDDSGVDQARLEQEIATLAVKADIREELDRLDAHLVAARDLIVNGSPLGRKLDFLMQEFNREANTLCSKSGDVELTRAGLALKSVVDQLKEQAANVE